MDDVREQPLSADQRRAIQWLSENPETILAFHQEGLTFIAVHPEHGVAISACDEEEFQARLNDRRPSLLKQLFLTNTSLWLCAAGGTQ